LNKNIWQNPYEIYTFSKVYCLLIRMSKEKGVVGNDTSLPVTI
jgi:hypothetical protein